CRSHDPAIIAERGRVIHGHGWGRTTSAVRPSGSIPPFGPLRTGAGRHGLRREAEDLVRVPQRVFHAGPDQPELDTVGIAERAALRQGPHRVHAVVELLAAPG